MLRQLACLVRGGHRWETTTDAAGSLTLCARCGKMQHGEGDIDSSGQTFYPPDADRATPEGSSRGRNR